MTNEERDTYGALGGIMWIMFIAALTTAWMGRWGAWLPTLVFLVASATFAGLRFVMRKGVQDRVATLQ